MEKAMYNIFYIIGVVVVVLFILGYLGAPLRPAPVQQNQAQVQPKPVPPDPPDTRVPR